MKIYIFLIIFLVIYILIFTLFKNCNKYYVKEIPHFLTDDECDFIIEFSSRKGFEKSALYEPTSNNLNENIRSSEQTWLYDSENAKIKELSKRIAKLTKLPIENQEALQIVHYNIGGKYNYHFDACKEDAVSCERMNLKGGQRYLTVLIYLNTVHEGGGTSFRNINKTVKAEKGKCVIFQNVDKKTGKILIESEHAGMPVLNGEKYICNKWIHMGPYK
jgi:prolyl 4-hydroxylase